MEKARQVNSTTSGILWMWVLLAKFLVVLLVDPMRVNLERAVRKVVLTYGGEDFREYARCDHASCPAVPPLSRLDATISEPDQGESSGITQSCKDWSASYGLSLTQDSTTYDT